MSIAALIPSSALAALRSRPAPLPRVTDRPPVLPTGARQRAERLVLPADVEAKTSARVSASGGTFAAVTRDVSATGLFLLTEQALEIGAEIPVSIVLPTLDESSVKSHSVRAKVVRQEPGRGYGIHFKAPSPELVAHIRELVKQRE